MNTETSRYKELGPLHDLLLKACPPDAKSKRSIPVLAKFLGCSHQYIYRWIEDGKIPPKFARALAEREGADVQLAEFLPFF